MVSCRKRCHGMNKEEQSDDDGSRQGRGTWTGNPLKKIEQQLIQEISNLEETQQC